MQDCIVPQRIADLRKLVGDAVFLPCNQGDGGKGPILPNYTTLLPSDMTPGHIRQCERDGYRIGVLLGRSSGGLCVIDCDCDQFAEEMLRLNPWLARTLTTVCNRGRSFWLRVTGAFPRKVDLYWNGGRVGEWRSDGAQSVIAGQDKSTGNWRRFQVRAPALAVSLDVLSWPEGTEAGGKSHRHSWLALVKAHPVSPDVERVEGVERRARSTSRTHARSTSGAAEEEDEREQKNKRLYRQLVSHLTAEPGNRNALLNQAVPYLVHAVCEKVVTDLLMKHFEEKGKTAGWKASWEEHKRSVLSLLAGCLESYPAKLPAAERGIYWLSCANVTTERILKYRFMGELAIIRIETPGLRRVKGQKGIATRWRWLFDLA